jgi:Putative zincin peptidase
MKILNKLPKSNPSLHLDLIKNGWVPMKEPKNLLTAILLSIPLMIVAAIICIGVINIFSTTSLSDFGLTPDSISITINLGIIFLLVLLLVLHELLHLIFIPNFIKSKKTYIGLTLFGGFVITEEEISKSRYIFITLAPFMIISIILPLILSVFGLLTTTLKFLIILNSMASSVDMLNLLLIIKQVPKNATLKSNGPDTYWKNVQMNEK